MDFDYLNQYANVIGVDEVGRGPLAGPVVSCAVEVQAKSGGVCQDLRKIFTDLPITDSKKLSEKKRQKILKHFEIDLGNTNPSEVYSLVDDDCLRLSYVISRVEPEDIDRMNILQASLFSMREAVSLLDLSLDTAILIDGNQFLKLKKKNTTEVPVVQGDSKSLIIGLASIIAKEYRDFLMRDYANEYPEYGFEKHAGYPTSLHREAIEQFGPSTIHRKSFKGVKEYVSTY